MVTSVWLLPAALGGRSVRCVETVETCYICSNVREATIAGRHVCGAQVCFEHAGQQAEAERRQRDEAAWSGRPSLFTVARLMATALLYAGIGAVSTALARVAPPRCNRHDNMLECSHCSLARQVARDQQLRS